MSVALLRRLLSLLIAAMPLSSQAIEEPDYKVLRTVEGVELRQYAAYVVEACTECRWHHLLRVLPISGRPKPRAARRDKAQ